MPPVRGRGATATPKTAAGEGYADSMLRLQRTAGNRAVTEALLGRRPARRGDGGHDHTSTAERGSPASTQRRAEGSVAVVQRAFGDDLAWSTAGSVTRSGEGAEGVLFVTWPGREVVVKFLQTAAGTEQANRTLAAAGVRVPDSRIVPNTDSDPMGAQIRALINTVKDTFSDTHKIQVMNQRRTYKYIQIQGKVAGVSLAKLNAGQVRDFVRNAALLEQVGRVAAIDAFLGNPDRLSKKLINTGNYILATGGEAPTLVAIDNDMKAQRAKNKALRESEVRFVMSPEGAKTLAAAFLGRLTGQFSKHVPTAEDITLVETSMATGIRAGAKQIIDLMAKQPGFINAAKTMEKTALPGPRGSGTGEREIVRKTLNARLAAVRDQYTGALAPVVAV
jgi:hypothetical protein